MMTKEKKQFISFVKGVLIILVVFAHCIQYGGTLSNQIFENKVFQVIYSFHMPLFALISGYLYGLQLEKYGQGELIVRKAASMIPPILSWGIISTLIHAFFYILNCREILFTQIMHLYLNQILESWWFVWGVLYCSFIVGVLYYNNLPVWLYPLIGVMLILIPDIGNIELYNYIYPFFAIGCAVKKIAGAECPKIFNAANKKFGMLAIALIYIIMIYNYKSRYFIYISGISLLSTHDIFEQMYINIYRFVIGGTGCILALYVSKKIFDLSSLKRMNQLLCYIGDRSMTIYMFSIMLNDPILVRIGQRINNNSFAVIIFETVIIIGTSLVVNNILSRNAKLRKIFLGNR